MPSRCGSSGKRAQITEVTLDSWPRVFWINSCGVPVSICKEASLRRS